MSNDCTGETVVREPLHRKRREGTFKVHPEEDVAVNPVDSLFNEILNYFAIEQVKRVLDSYSNMLWA